jgi:protein-tyrosine phosphatase
MTSENPAAILAICTGNLCRSPVVERLLRVGLTTRWPSAASALPVARAGTAAALGQRMPDAFASRLRSIGAGTAAFEPRQITAEMLDGAELVITATRAHRAAVVELHPRAVRYTFTLRELARLAASLPPGDRAPLDPVARLQAFVTAAGGARGASLPGDPMADDIADPYGGTDALYGRVWNSLVDATTAILTAFCPVGSTILPSAGARSL